LLGKSEGLCCRRWRISLEEHVLRRLADLLQGLGHSECEENQYRWNEVYGRQTRRDKWKGKFEDAC